MNIEQLLKTAGFTQEEIEKISIAKMAVFAELIALECAEIVASDNHNNGDEWCRALSQAEYEIRSTFGIEE